LDGMTLSKRKEIIEAIRKICLENVETLSRMAVEETGLGRFEDKIIKNKLVINETPGTEILRPISYTGDHGLTLIERAPYGVIGSITPCTNPTETIICNGIGMIAGGNTVVFNTHPTAKKVSVFVVDLINKAIMNAGGPQNVLTTVETPTIESANQLMKHPDIALLVVTGGPAVVKAAMNSGKKVIGAGPGNPPAVVDETADIPQAAKDIVSGASLDNNIICIVEKEVLAVDSICNQLKSEMVKNGAYELNSMQTKRLEKLLVQEPYSCTCHGVVNKNFVGKDAKVILKAIDVDVSDDIRLIITDVPFEHQFVQCELLMPVLPIVRVSDVDTAIDLAKKAEHGFRHTAVMHSRNIDKLSKMARLINTSIFVKNGPSYSGLGFTGEGYTSFTIASPTGEGITTAINFTRERRCTLKDRFRIV
ncbi:MAG: aldehyde dehydrogenase EutE, partial [Nitrospinae bacterium]|nr:aldehyde dehydrogenase EutE [Nitrospinota bacterium]